MCNDNPLPSAEGLPAGCLCRGVLGHFNERATWWELGQAPRKRRTSTQCGGVYRRLGVVPRGTFRSFPRSIGGTSPPTGRKQCTPRRTDHAFRGAGLITATLSPQIGQVISHLTKAVCSYCVFQPLFPMYSCVVSANSLESRQNRPEPPKRNTADGLAPMRQVLRRAAARNEGET